MRTHEFWRDAVTMEIWAVELTDGIVTGCAGPLHPSSVSPDFLESYRYETADAPRLEACRERFELLDARHLYLLDD